MRYKAFISYSQKDRWIAKKIHRALERFRVPKGSFSSDLKGQRLGRFFIDNDEIGASSDLKGTLEHALDNSDNLIVVCSPDSAKSKWVDAEVRHFKKRNRGEVFAVIANGKPNASDPSQECFVPSLKVGVNEKGQLTTSPAEPRAPDLQKTKFSKVIVELISGLAKLPFDDIWQRNKIRSRNRRLMFWSSGVVLVCVASGWYYYSISLYQEKTTESTYNESLALVALSENASLLNRNRDALKLAISAWPSDISTNRPKLRSTLYAFDKAVSGPIEKLRLLHQFDVEIVVFSPNGETIATVAQDAKLRIWDLRTGKLKHRPMSHGPTLISAQFSPGGDRLVTTGADGRVLFWDAKTGEAIDLILEHDESVLDAVYSPDANTIVTVSGDYTARLWDSESGTPLAPPMNHPATVHSAAFSPDGKWLATASLDHLVRIWDAYNGEFSGIELNHKARVQSVSYSSDNTRILTSSDDGTAQQWDARTGARINPSMSHKNPPKFAVFSKDKKWIATASYQSVQIWDSSNSKLITEIPHSSGVNSVEFSANSALLLTTSYEGSAHLWKVPTGVAQSKPLWHEGSVQSAIFSSDEKLVATASLDGTVRVWETAKITGNPVIEPLLHNGEVNIAKISPVGRYIFSGTDHNNEVYIWDYLAKILIQKLQHPGQGKISAIAISSAATHLASASTNGSIQIWNVRTGKKIGEPLKHTRVITSLAFSPDGRVLASASYDKTVRLWDVNTGALIGTPMVHESFVLSVNYFNDGKRIASTTSDGKLHIWNIVDQLNPQRTFYHGVSDRVESASISPDDRYVLTVFDKNIFRWNLESGNKVRLPSTHSGFIGSVQYSPDGSKIVTASMDNTTRVWDALTGLPYGVPIMHSNYVRHAEFSKNGDFILTASADGTVGLWHTPIEKDTGFKIGCNLIGIQNGLQEIEKTYGLQKLGSICNNNPSGFHWETLVERTDN